MRAKRFMYLSVGILCLALSAAVGFHIGSSSVQADASASSGITLHDQLLSGLVADETGTWWKITGSDCWLNWGDDIGYPVPTTNIKFIGRNFLITKDNHAWARDEGWEPWQDCGPWPGGAINSNSSTLGNVKDKYKGGDR